MELSGHSAQMHLEKHVADRISSETHRPSRRVAEHDAGDTLPVQEIAGSTDLEVVVLHAADYTVQAQFADNTDLALGRVICHAHTAGMAGHWNHNRTELILDLHRWAPEVVHCAVDRGFAGHSSDLRLKGNCHTAAAAAAVLGCIVVARDIRLADPEPRMCSVSW